MPVFDNCTKATHKKKLWSLQTARPVQSSQSCLLAAAAADTTAAVYFDQHYGVAHSNSRSKYAFSCFCMKNVKRRVKQ